MMQAYHLAQAQEDTIDDAKCGNVAGVEKVAVDAGHDVAHNSLRRDKDDEGRTRPDPVAHPRAKEGAREVESLKQWISWGSGTERRGDGR